MKLGLISDVHGDILALERAWAHLARLGAEKIVCAGDLVGYGPSPDQVVAFLARHQIASARGNHDRWALQRPPGSPDEFGGGTPTAATLALLRALEPYTLVAGAGRIGVIVHGSPRSDMEFVTRRSHPPSALRGYLEAVDADLVVVGHTHEPMWYRCDRGLFVNPGSLVSGSIVQSSSSFALVELDALSVSFHDVETGRAIETPAWDETEDAPASSGPRPGRGRVR